MGIIARDFLLDFVRNERKTVPDFFLKKGKKIYEKFLNKKKTHDFLHKNEEYCLNFGIIISRKKSKQAEDAFKNPQKKVLVILD